ncbi:MAG: DUF5312 domain-containing protein [Spirochaetes bacterium]|nr:DUF5312 domain-containing protein [Spirochaetota bacterium]
MEGTSVFDKLVADLTTEERKNLLERIQKLHPLSEEPMMANQQDEVEVNVEREFQGLSLFEKILLWIRAFFTRRIREEVLEEHLVRKLGRELQRKAPGLVDLKRKVVLPSFAETVERLKPHLSVLGAFISLLTGNRRTQFISFLAAFEMENTTERLKTELDPFYLIALHWYHLEPPFASDALVSLEIPPTEQLSDADLRRMLDNRLEDILAGIAQEEKSRMYLDIRFLDRLSQLVYFPVDRILSAFRALPELPYAPCPFNRLREPLALFTEIMYSLRDPIPAVLLETLVLFKMGDFHRELDRAEEKHTISQSLLQLEEAFQAIRNFLQKVPLLTLMKVLTGRVNYRCIERGGGEDWFNQFKQHWRARLDEAFRSFLDIRRKDELGKAMSALFAPTPLPIPYGKNVRECSIFLLGFIFLRTFFQTIFFSTYNRPLRILLLEGQFYKADNRKEYTEAFGNLLKLGEELEKSTIPESWESLPSTQKETLESQVLRWSEQFRDSLQSLVRVLDGVLFGEAGGRYDTLSNLGSIGGRGNAQLLQSLNEVLKGATETVSVVERLILLEKKRS